MSVKQSCRFVVAMVLTGGVAGCFVMTATSSFTQKDLAKQADAARTATTTQADVHRLLGEPWLASERFRVEVYRKTGNYHELLVTFGLLPFPIPAPIPLPKEDLTGYTLVGYSDAGVVEAVDTALSKYPAVPLAHIQVGDFAFTEYTPLPGAPPGAAGQALIVSHERFVATVTRGDVRSCTVLVACSATWCNSNSPIEMQLDDNAATSYTLGKFGHPLVPLTPEPGTHTLRFRAEGNPGWGEISTEFTCRAAEPRYVMPTALVRTTRSIQNLFTPHSRLEGTVQIQGEVPAEFRTSGVLLWTDGRWLVAR